MKPGTIVETSDSQILEALSDPIALGAIELLLDAPHTQKQIGERLGVGSALLSRRMSLLESAGIAERERRRGHGPYDLTHAAATRALLLATADLAAAIQKDRTARQEQRVRDLRKKALDGGHERDRLKDGA
jgi:DNA-binding transcriptional ArsR family regulator